jgi:hypothetical protein
MASDAEDLRNRAMDGLTQVADRVNAIENLGRSGSADALRTLLELGERQEEPVGILRASGAALAVLTCHGADISEFDMRNLQGPAYEAYCEWGP